MDRWRTARPKPDELVVTFFDAESLDANSNRTIPTWWNDTVLREADKPEVSADGRVYTYTFPWTFWVWS